jgi:hypothetical protein
MTSSKTLVAILPKNYRSFPSSSFFGDSVTDYFSFLILFLFLVLTFKRGLLLIANRFQKLSAKTKTEANDLFIVVIEHIYLIIKCGVEAVSASFTYPTSVVVKPNA